MDTFLVIITSFMLICFNVSIGNPKPDNDVHFHIDMDDHIPLQSQELGSEIASGEDYFAEIAGGRKVKKNKYKFMVAIGKCDYDDVSDIHCGGALITRRLVLSAFHCGAEYEDHEKRHPDPTDCEDNCKSSGEHTSSHDLKKHGKKVSYKGFCAFLGTRKFGKRDNFEKIKIADSKYPKQPEYVFHEKPKYNEEHDFIMFILERKPRNFLKTIFPICLPKGNYRLEGKKLKVIGWGETKKRDESENLLVADISCCDRNPTGNNFIHVVPRKNKKGVHMLSCAGDSGGPLFYQDGKIERLVGTVSKGPDCKGKKFDDTEEFNNVAKWLKWIKKKMKKLGEKQPGYC